MIKAIRQIFYQLFRMSRRAFLNQLVVVVMRDMASRVQPDDFAEFYEIMQKYNQDAVKQWEQKKQYD